MSTTPDQDLKQKLKASILTPKTDFNMKAGLTEREPQTLARWDEKGLYDAIRAKRKGAPKFVLHDGPPYANGDAHTGTGMNKILKDMVVKFRTMQGYDSPYIPGWDCHGLPIEHKVLEELGGRKPENMSALELRQRCLAFARGFIDQQRRQFQRTFTLGRWDTPYLTINPVYEGGVLDCFADLMQRGYITRALKPVHWSWAAQSALAEAELEYANRKDPSIYVKFRVSGGASNIAEKAQLLNSLDIDLVIWTTTPWTLPANIAVAVAPQAEYGVYAVGDEAWILASSLAEQVFAKAGVKGRELVIVKGSDLLELTYSHVLWDTHGHRVVAADYVTMEDGTGLVHTAPGHGAEDFHTGTKEGLPIVCPVNEEGKYYSGDSLLEQLKLSGSDLTASAAAWIEKLQGQQIFAANKLIIDGLVASGQMVHWFEFEHSYPHCWRTKKPVIFRATEQWFVSIDHTAEGESKTLRQKLIEQIEASKWFPAWGRKRISGMVESRPDWCISRQRYWGIPIPAFRETESGKVCCDNAVAQRIADVVREHGSDVWFDEANWPADKLLPDEFRPEEFKGKTLERMHDIFDVWFESGASHRGVVAAEAELQDWSEQASSGAGSGTGIPAGVRAEHSGSGTGIPAGVPSNLQETRRNLPHFQAGGSTYFITWTTRGLELSEEERQIVLDCCTKFDGVRYDVFSAVVMTDHVHLLLKPLEKAPRTWWDLGEIVKGMKGASARAINERRGTSGSIWLDERFDRIVRNEMEFSEKWNYINQNPVNAALSLAPEAYPFLVVNSDERGWLKKTPAGMPVPLQESGMPVPLQDTGKPFRPADLYLEGDDQHRGWFQVSLILATATKGVSPFKECLTSAFVVDEKGQKGSKSKGNIFAIDWGCEQVGADLMRLYFASVDTSSPIPVTLDLIREKTGNSYRSIRNAIRMLLGNLQDFDPNQHAVALESLNAIDKWAISRLGRTVKDVTAAFDVYENHVALRKLVEYINGELSSFYLDVTKDSLYCDAPDSPRRRSSQTAMYVIASTLIRVLAPVCPHTADEAWSYLPGVTDALWSVHMADWPMATGRSVVSANSGEGSIHPGAVFNLTPDDAVEAHFEVLRSVRNDTGRVFDKLVKDKSIKSTASLRIKLACPEKAVREALSSFSPDELATFLNVAEVELVEALAAGAPDAPVESANLAWEESGYEKCQRSWVFRRDVKARPELHGLLLSDRDAAVLTAQWSEA